RRSGPLAARIQRAGEPGTGAAPPAAGHRCRRRQTAARRRRGPHGRRPRSPERRRRGLVNSMAGWPTGWVLLGRGAGGNFQMTSLATALGWPYETKHLVYNRFSHCPNLVLGAAAIGVDRRRSTPLLPPWPDVVIAGSRRSAPVARWIRKQSG